MLQINRSHFIPLILARNKCYISCKKRKYKSLAYLQATRLAFMRLQSTNIHPLIYFPKLWNNFPSKIRSTSNQNIFKKELKSHFLDQLSDNFKCGRLLCPHCHSWFFKFAFWAPAVGLLVVFAVGVSPFSRPGSLPLITTSNMLLGCLGSYFRNPSDYANLCLYLRIVW